MQKTRPLLGILDSGSAWRLLRVDSGSAFFACGYGRGGSGRPDAHHAHVAGRRLYADGCGGGGRARRHDSRDRWFQGVCATRVWRRSRLRSAGWTGFSTSRLAYVAITAITFRPALPAVTYYPRSRDLAAFTGMHWMGLRFGSSLTAIIARPSVSCR
jgi:hypothetical protein